MFEDWKIIPDSICLLVFAIYFLYIKWQKSDVFRAVNCINIILQ